MRGKLQEKKIFSVKKHFEKEFMELFENQKYNNIPCLKYSFHSIDKIEKNSVLYIGLNPSRTDDEKLENNFYNLEQDNDGTIGYWKAFQVLSEKINERWTHLDLLVMRETKQKHIRDLLKIDSGKNFINQQLMISKQILESIDPKIILVTNTLSRDFLGKTQIYNKGIRIGYNYKFDKTIGTDRIINPDSSLNGVPVFFTSMLSGQRALDLGSRERLIWHINHTKNILHLT